MKNKNISLELDDSEDDEAVDKIADELLLALVAKKLIDLEKDLLFPGTAVSDGARRLRIMEQIEKENF
jgi:hypothetical protein